MKKIRIASRGTKLRSTFSFDRKQAIRLCKTEYYIARARDMRNMALIERERRKLATLDWEAVGRIISRYKKKGLDDWQSPTARTLKGIYNKNLSGVKTNSPVFNSNLLNVISSPEMLLLAYKAIKGNKGALTKAAEPGFERLNSLSEEQRRLLFESESFPDRFSLEAVYLASRLIRKGLYPWGSSLRVQVPKPGVRDKMRPITIPPFMDRVVQKAIAMVLEAIYEPDFDSLNRSFGFRSGRGCHDAIVALTSNYSSGKTMAIEGDIEAAYDTVDKDILISILSRKIKDRKFLTLIRERLDYDFVQYTDDGEVRIRPPLGIPQGGIDSPYLFNIYMHELDKFVHEQVQLLFDKLNARIKVRSYNRNWNSAKALMEKNLRRITKIKGKLRSCEDAEEAQRLRNSLFSAIKDRRLLNHRKNRLVSRHPHRKQLSFLYVRYADDWILLTNANYDIAKRIKDMISDFLLSDLKLRLSDKKTVITDITKNPARFLGFELRHPARGYLCRKPTEGYYKLKKATIQRVTGSTIVWATVDKQRLINRLHMKGNCDATGFPRELPWLSALEPQIIVERFNAAMYGLANYYLGAVRNPSAIQRWIYILHYSCLKTLAQKYRTKISRIKKRFGILRDNKSKQTIQIPVYITLNGIKYRKTWTLHTYQWLKENLLPTKRLAFNQIKYSFWELDKKGYYPDRFTLGETKTAVTRDDFVEKMSWVSLRTQARMDLPCAYCGTFEGVHQHHIRAIRKTAYELISKEMDYKKILSLRNRNQVPLCRECHRTLVHGGQYDNVRLSKMMPTKTTVDNRIINIESYVKPGVTYHAKSLEEKGWKAVQ